MTSFPKVHTLVSEHRIAYGARETLLKGSLGWREHKMSKMTLEGLSVLDNQVATKMLMETDSGVTQMGCTV